MIDYFYDYIRNIILFLVFMSFIQVILPNNKYRSYINLVFGMILIFIMIQPINNIFNETNSIDSLNIFNKKDFEINSNIDSEKYKDVQNKMVKNAFQDNIKAQVESILKNEYTIKEISLELYENKYEEINIDKIYLTLNKFNKNIYIKPFNEDEIMQNIEKKEKNNIKNLISDFYNMPNENIFITIA